MARVNIQDLVTGMILSETVLDRSGRKVLSAGSPITDKHLRIFKMWGITQVAVDTGSTEPSGKSDRVISQGQIEIAEEEARQLFRHTDLDDPVIGSLFQVIVQRKARQRSPEGQVA